MVLSRSLRRLSRACTARTAAASKEYAKEYVRYIPDICPNYRDSPAGSERISQTYTRHIMIPGARHWHTGIVPKWLVTQKTYSDTGMIIMPDTSIPWAVTRHTPDILHHGMVTWSRPGCIKYQYGHRHGRGTAGWHHDDIEICMRCHTSGHTSIPGPGFIPRISNLNSTRSKSLSKMLR
jgi:hypothetical protein